MFLYRDDKTLQGDYFGSYEVVVGIHLVLGHLIRVRVVYLEPGGASGQDSGCEGDGNDKIFRREEKHPAHEFRRFPYCRQESRVFFSGIMCVVVCHGHNVVRFVTDPSSALGTAGMAAVGTVDFRQEIVVCANVAIPAILQKSSLMLKPMLRSEGIMK